MLFTCVGVRSNDGRLGSGGERKTSLRDDSLLNSSSRLSILASTATTAAPRTRMEQRTEDVESGAMVEVRCVYSAAAEADIFTGRRSGSN